MLSNDKIKNVILNPFFILRGLSSGAKLLFVLYLASFSAGSVVGQYAMLVTIVAIAVQLIGFDISTIVGRLIHRVNASNKLKLLKAQYITYLVSYFLFYFVFVFLFYSFVVEEFFWALLFGVIVILEHSFTEVFRTLVSLIHVRLATVIQFFKTVPYVVIIVVFSFFYDIKISIDLILLCWLFNLVCVFIVFLFLFRHKLSFFFSCNIQVFEKSKEIFFDAAPYFSITIFSVFFSQIDKFFINEYMGHESLGVYFTFFTICSVLTLFISLTVGVNQGPAAIKVFSKNGVSEYLEVRRMLIKSYFKYMLLGFFVCLFIGFSYAHFSGKESYDVLFVLLLSSAILPFGDVFRLDLYLLEKDKVLLYIYLYSLLLNLLLLYFFVAYYGLFGAAFASLLSSSIIVITMFLKSKKYILLASKG